MEVRRVVLGLLRELPSSQRTELLAVLKYELADIEKSMREP
jgi:hypothetical protein